jgi:hypothetical protein
MVPCVPLVGLFTVVAQLYVSPPTPSVAPLESVSFTASGGVEPYIFDLVAHPSGGTVTPDGVYTAGPSDAPDGGDRVRATDKLGITGFASVTVVSPYVPPPPATGCGVTGRHHFPFLGLFLVTMLLQRKRRG